MPAQNRSARSKTVMKSLAKVKQPKVARVELRAGGGLHGPEKPKVAGKVASSLQKSPKNIKRNLHKGKNN